MLRVVFMDKPVVEKAPSPPAAPITSEVLLVAIDQEARAVADDFEDEEITQELIAGAR